MSTHTPGPWSWIDGDGNEGTLSAPSGKVIESAPYEGMFFSSDGDITANRALIAARSFCRCWKCCYVAAWLLRKRLALGMLTGAMADTLSPAMPSQKLGG